MANLQGNDDPFAWDVDRVVKELCTTARTWHPPPHLMEKFPNLVQLEAKLREHAYDGFLLLGSLQPDSESDLWNELGITQNKFKFPLRQAIKWLQKRSPAYQEFCDEVTKTALNDDQPTMEESKFRSPGLTGRPTPEQGPDDVYMQASAQALTEATAAPSEATAGSSEPTGRKRDTDSATEQPKNKKRRLEATALLPATSELAGRFAIPTEADMIDGGDLLARLASGPTAYWGEGSLNVNDIFVFDATVDSDQEFTMMRPKRIGPAKARWVHRKLKIFLLEPVESRRAESELPALGESDNEDDAEWDSIEREYEEELEDVRKEKLREQTKYLQPEEVDTCIQGMKEKLIAQWQDKKLPALQRKAHKMWTLAAQRRTRHTQVIQLSQSLLSETSRLDAKVANIKDNCYTSERELLKMSEFLDPTVFEMERLKWHIEVLKGVHAPKKVTAPPTRTVTKKDRVAADGGIDIWSEEDDDGLDGFIINDDLPARAGSHCHPTDTADDDLPGLPFFNNQDDEAMDIDVPDTRHGGQSFESVSDDVEMYDLTQFNSSDDAIDLRTPLKSNSKSSPSDGPPPFSEPKEIAKKSSEFWHRKGDVERLVITLLCHHAPPRQKKILEAALYTESATDFWQDQIAVAINSTVQANDPEQASDKTRREVAVSIARLFDAFMGSFSTVDKAPKVALKEMMDRLAQTENSEKLPEFWAFLRAIAPYFGVKEEGYTSDQDLDVEEATTPHQKSKNAKLRASARIRRDEENGTQAKEARRIEFRRAVGSSQLAEGNIGLVINESKEDWQGLICVDQYISDKIRPHQIEGVRFMWDEITKDTQKGCLLAHSMGLGKTMQVITLLVALANAVSSEDEAISLQIPHRMRSMKVVILCPPGLMNNWENELGIWTPPNMLLPIQSLISGCKQAEHLGKVKNWADSAYPSILLCGYSIFRGLESPIRSIIGDTCSIVIADEAHIFKNEKSGIRSAVLDIKTTSRIALTGSPLSNNIDEYFSMIDWVSPGFLGERQEFTKKWGGPITRGFALGSSRAETKKAKILLHGLKKMVETKVHRRSTQVMKGSLPPKIEYIIYLDLTEIQVAAYKAYLRGDRRDRAPGAKLGVQNVWALQVAMTILLAHPAIYYGDLKKAQVPKSQGKKANAKNCTPDDEEEIGFERPIEVSTEVMSETLKVFRDSAEFGAMEASNKMVAVEKILDECFELGDNVLIFSQRIPVLDFIEQRLLKNKGRPYSRLDGGVKSALRQDMVDEFNKGRSQVFLISTTAGGVGLNLQGANRVVFMDFKYNPQNEQQAVGRAYRIGQTRPVTVYWLICEGTFEIQMQSQQVFKTQLTSRVVDSKAPIAKADSNLTKWFSPPEIVPHTDTSAFRGRDPVLDAVLDLEFISSMENAESFEEEELGAELQPDELEQANQMILGNISEVLLPPDPVRQPSFPLSSDLQPTPQPATQPTPQPETQPIPQPAMTGTEQTSKVNPPQPATPLNQQTIPLTDYVCERTLSLRPRRLSAPADTDAVPTNFAGWHIRNKREPGPALQRLLHGPASVNNPVLDVSANTSAQTLAGTSSTSHGFGMPSASYAFGVPNVDIDGTPDLNMQPAPPPLGVLGPEQVLKRALVGTNDQPGSDMFAISQPIAPVFGVTGEPSHNMNPASNFAASKFAGASSMSPTAPTLASHNGAWSDFRQKFTETLGPSKIAKFEAFVPKIVDVMRTKKLGGLQERTVWNKLLAIFDVSPEVAEAIADQRVAAHTLVTESQVQILDIAQDPDVAREFSRRSSKNENRTSSAADFAVMANVLRNRNEHRPVKQEKQQSKTPMPSEGRGSKHDPLVID